jgi:hypothetical protein
MVQHETTRKVRPTIMLIGLKRIISKGFRSTALSHLRRDDFIFVQSCVFGLSLVLIWLMQYWNLEGNPNLIGRISFKVADEPWVPSGQIAEPIFGLHFFGDWMLSVAWAINENCYQLGQFSCQQPPLGLWILRIWNIVFIDMRFGYLIWVLVASLIYIFLVQKLLKTLSLSSKFLFFLVFVLAAPGNLISMDRGSLHFMTFSLLGLSYYLYKQESYFWALVLITISASFKPQMILALLILIHHRKFRYFFVAVLASTLSNLLLLLTFPGELTSNLLGFFRASLGYVNSEASFGNIMNSVSIIGITSRYFEASAGWGSSLTHLTNYSEFLVIPGLIWLCLVVFLLLNQKISSFASITLILSLTSLIVPASSPYTMGWATLAMLIFFEESTKVDNEFTLRKAQNYQLFFLMIITITPGFVFYNEIPGFSRHIPLIIFLPLVLCWIYISEAYFLMKERDRKSLQRK